MSPAPSQLSPPSAPEARHHELLSCVQHLPALPVRSAEVLRLVEDLNSTHDEIATAITQDAGLTIGVLRLANSAAFGCAGEVQTVGQALRQIGLVNLKTLVLGSAMRQLIQPWDLIDRLRTGTHHAPPG